LRYWLSRPPAERVAAVEYLRRQCDGARARLRRVYRSGELTPAPKVARKVVEDKRKAVIEPLYAE
jgi:hypothetical protein